MSISLHHPGISGEKGSLEIPLEGFWKGSQPAGLARTLIPHGEIALPAFAPSPSLALICCLFELDSNVFT